MTIKVFYPRTIEKNALQVLKKDLDPQVELYSGKEMPDPADYDILIAGRPTKEELEASPNLRMVVIPWAGLPDVTAEIMQNYPQITLYNLHHNAVATGETALMLLFTAAKQILPIEKIFRKNDWRPRYRPNPAQLLQGKNILILGFGSIGQYVGKVCHAVGMKVNAIRRNPETKMDLDYPVKVFAPDQLHKLLPSNEILMITLPLTNETHGMIGKEAIALMPEQSIIINVGRGLVVDQKALYQALLSKKLHSAGIDVWYNYPPDEKNREDTAPADFPFHELDNIVMSPHRGGGAVEIEKLRMQHLAILLNAAARGEKLPNMVDLNKGY